MVFLILLRYSTGVETGVDHPYQVIISNLQILAVNISAMVSKLQLNLFQYICVCSLINISMLPLLRLHIQSIFRKSAPFGINCMHIPAALSQMGRFGLSVRLSVNFRDGIDVRIPHCRGRNLFFYS